MHRNISNDQKKQLPLWPFVVAIIITLGYGGLDEYIKRSNADAKRSHNATMQNSK